MQRRNAIVLCAFIVSCGGARKPLAEVLPAELPGGLKRGDVRPLTDIPSVIAQLGVEESAQTTYAGTALRIFRMKADTSAFELIQKWRQSEGLAAYKGPYFFVANGERAADVLRALQSTL
jgi:hypothetical protein